MSNLHPGYGKVSIHITRIAAVFSCGLPGKAHAWKRQTRERYTRHRSDGLTWQGFALCLIRDESGIRGHVHCRNDRR